MQWWWAVRADVLFFCFLMYYIYDIGSECVNVGV